MQIKIYLQQQQQKSNNNKNNNIYCPILPDDPNMHKMTLKALTQTQAVELESNKFSNQNETKSLNFNAMENDDGFVRLNLVRLNLVQLNLVRLNLV